MACFLEIIVDNRETSLFNNMIDRDLDQYQIKISKKQLEIGDIHIIFNDNIYIYERKTMNDLMKYRIGFALPKEMTDKSKMSQYMPNGFSSQPIFSFVKYTKDAVK
jgi:hypothetical protein